MKTKTKRIFKYKDYFRAVIFGGSKLMKGDLWKKFR